MVVLHSRYKGLMIRPTFDPIKPGILFPIALVVVIHEDTRLEKIVVFTLINIDRLDQISTAATRPAFPHVTLMILAAGRFIGHLENKWAFAASGLRRLQQLQPISVSLSAPP
jgi:hypothetical protein